MENYVKKSSKTSNGITLIALVITIIILLILAGISISMLSGDNSILSRATDAKTETEKGQEKEIIALAYNSALTKKVGNGDSTAVTAEDLNSELTSQGASAYGSNPINVTFTNSKRQYNIDSNGLISLNAIKIAEFSIKPTGVQKSSPTIPNGFYYVGGTINNGYVISDNINDENKYMSSNDVGTDLQGNQFVWIPVAQNQKITLNISSEEDITSIKLTDPVGKNIALDTFSGKTYINTEIVPTINGGYKVEVNTANYKECKLLVVRSLYAMDTFKDEPLTSDPLPRHKETEDRTNSVNTNGGFYIGRYEATYVKGKAASKPATSIRLSKNGVPTACSTELKDGMLWNFISQPDALEKANEYNEKSSLLTGSAWYRTLDWLIETNSKTLFQVSSDSGEWGNYSNDKFSNNTSLAKTGEYLQTKTNNIYDLAGNLFEWTTLSYWGSYRRNIGGSFSVESSNNPASVCGRYL